MLYSIPCILWIVLGRTIATIGFFDGSENQALSPPYKVEAVAGSIVKLPCYIPLLPTGDKVHTVIWYKEGTALNKHSPIYTYDVRGKALNDGKHFSDSHILGNRSDFHYEEKPPKLIIADVKQSDQGIYNCRVDYKSSPTGNFRVNLTVITAPEKLLILDERQLQIEDNILGPYNEGEWINTTCVAIGGNPPPTLTWWLENTLVDNFSEYVTKGRVKNTLYMNKLERKHHNVILTCQASSANGTVPISTSATLELNLKPLSIQLLGKQNAVTVGIEHELSCQVKGSRPPPKISWWKDGNELLPMKEITSVDNTTTTSYLNMFPSIEDNAKLIECVAVHPVIPNVIMKDHWLVNVYNVPYVTLTLGSNMEENNIIEGTDVYLECNVVARPPHYSLTWKYNNANISYDNSDGIIATNQTLIFQHISRNKTGEYACAVRNEVGYGESNNVKISVQYSPICKTNQTVTYRTSMFEPITIVCELDANPPLIDFTWTLTSDDGKMKELSGKFINSTETISLLSYTPTSDKDFLTIYCSGTNHVGTQSEPCAFHIKPLGTPESPSECKVIRQTDTTLFVHCFHNQEQPEPQLEIQVFGEDTNLISTLTFEHSIFTIEELNPGSGYDLVIYAKNKKGKSVPLKLQTFTLEPLEDYTVLPRDTMKILLVLSGGVGAIILLALIIVVMVRLSDQDDEDSEGFRNSCQFLHLDSDRSNNGCPSHPSIDSIAAYSCETK